LDAHGSYWDFDQDGKIHEGVRNSLADYMNLPGFGRPHRKDGRVIDLVPEIKRRQVQAKHSWTLTKEDIDKVAMDLWPGYEGPKLEVTGVKGICPKKPPLSRDAREALYEISGKIGSINFALEGLSEPALKGLAFEARRSASYEHESLWEGVAGEADRQRQLLAARRTGKGEWYAVIEMFISTGGHTAEVHTAAFEKCLSRPVAIEAGKRLMKEQVDRLSPNVTMEVKIYSALEWTPQD
jgi:hypothetical protein